MFENSCPKSVPGLTNIPKNTKQVSPPATFTLLHGIGQSLFSILSPNGVIGLECPHPVIFSPFRILIICLIKKCYGNISKKTTMTFTFKMLKQMFLHTCFILCIFTIIAFVIVPSNSKFISGFPYILLITTLIFKKINQTVIITVEFMVYLETSTCCSARKSVSF